MKYLVRIDHPVDLADHSVVHIDRPVVAGLAEEELAEIRTHQLVIQFREEEGELTAVLSGLLLTLLSSLHVRGSASVLSRLERRRWGAVGLSVVLLGGRSSVASLTLLRRAVGVSSGLHRSSEHSLSLRSGQFRCESLRSRRVSSREL